MLLSDLLSRRPLSRRPRTRTSSIWIEAAYADYLTNYRPDEETESAEEALAEPYVEAIGSLVTGNIDLSYVVVESAASVSASYGHPNGLDQIVNRGSSLNTHTLQAFWTAGLWSWML